MDDKFIYAFNVKCAKFVGLEPCENDKDLFFDHEYIFSRNNKKIHVSDMQFYCDWNWLMKVIPKVNEAHFPPKNENFYERIELAELKVILSGCLLRAEIEGAVMEIDHLINLIEKNNYKSPE